jgi:hypothetical protein
MSDKPVTDQAKDAAQGVQEGVAGQPSMFDKDGAVGKQFQPDGAVGGYSVLFPRLTPFQSR